MGKSVSIIGGGIAGLSAAVFLNEKGFDVKLFEGSPKLGGRAYSYYDREKDMFFDNGQHILAGWYKNTFEYLKIIGSYSKLNFQNGLEVNFLDECGKRYKLKCPDEKPPMNLIRGLLRYNALGLKDKFALKNIQKLFSDEFNHKEKYLNVRELLTGIRQTPRLIKFFWEPLTLAVFNTGLENIAVEVFLNVMKKGFEKSEIYSTLVIPEVNLNELLIDDAVTYFKKNSVEIFLDKRVDRIILTNSAERIIMEDKTEIISDYYISAVSFFSFKKLFDEKTYYENNFKTEFFKTSAIVSVHLFFEHEIPEKFIPDNSFGMTGLIGTIVQWIFRRNAKHISLVISGSDNLQITEMKNEEIYELCINDLRKTIQGFDNVRVSDYRIIKEKRATFIPDFASCELRPLQRTKYENFFIAGDWTDTGLPATIESAVTSAAICSQMINE